MASSGTGRDGFPKRKRTIVQEILLAVHLKRHTWDPAAPFGPWLFAIARNKLIDALRRKGRRVFVDIEEFADVLPSEPEKETVSTREVDQHLAGLPPKQRDVVRSIAVDSASIKETAAKLTMSEGVEGVFYLLRWGLRVGGCG